MNSKIFFFSLHLFCYCLAFPLHAQTLRGRTIDEKGEPLPYINIAIYQPEDSALIAGTMSDESGQFNFSDIKQGNYRLKVSAVGYQTHPMNLQVHEKESINLEDITLKQDNITLNEIIIKAKQNPLSVNRGKYVLNVNKSELRKQATIFDVLSFLPGVTSSGNGISVIGKGSPLIMLNGREVRSLAELEVLQPDQIKEVSVDNHPSAEYSSQYNSVILITTVGKLKDYVSSQLFHTSTFARKYNDREGANINILHGKWSHFLSYQIKDYRSKDKAKNRYELYDSSTNSLIGNNSSDNRATGHSDTHNLIMSTSYKFNTQNNLNIQYSLDYDNNRNHANTDEETSLNNETILHATDQNIKNKSQLHNIEAMFVHKGTEGESLSLTGGYIYAKDNLSNLINTDKTQLNRIDGNNDYQSATLKADYKRNIFAGSELQVGGKFVNTRNSGNSESYNPIDKNYFYKNKTILKDGMLAGYVTLNHQFKRIYVSAGIRAEYTNSDYSQDGEKLYNKKDFNLYPTINCEYTINPNVIITGGYENKSSRPSFSQLSPIIRYINAMLYEKGNPELKLMNSHNAYLALILHRKFSIEASYTYKRDLPMYILQTNPQVEGSLVNSPVNINASYYLLATSYSDKWGIYRFSYNGAIMYDVTKLPYLGKKDSNLHPRFTLSTVNQFDVCKQTMLFCNFNVSSKYQSLGTQMKPTYDLTLGILKTFFKDNRLQVIISANDILHKALPNSTTNINHVRSQKILDPDSRNITVSIKYNLNSFRNMFQKNKANAEELNRIVN